MLQVLGGSGRKEGGREELGGGGQDSRRAGLRREAGLGCGPEVSPKVLQEATQPHSVHAVSSDLHLQHSRRRSKELHGAAGGKEINSAAKVCGIWCRPAGLANPAQFRIAL